MDCSSPSSSVHGILQAIILEWEPFPSPGDLPNPGTEPKSPALQADSLLSESPEKLKQFVYHDPISVDTAHTHTHTHTHVPVYILGIFQRINKFFTMITNEG